MSDVTCLHSPIRAVCFDWGGTLMVDDGPAELPMCSWPRVAVIPGARECLAELDGLVPLCVATNAAASSRHEIECALDRGGLRRYFSQVFCFTEIGHRKSQPEFWGAVQERLGIPLSQVVMVGDSLEHDIRPPRSLGVQTVWFNERGAEPEATVLTVTELPQLVSLVEHALAPTRAHGTDRVLPSPGDGVDS